MAKDQGADKTEQPTAKKLRDARKDANVSKSKELTSTVLVLGWLVGGWMLLGFMWGRMRALFDASFDSIGTPFAEAAPILGRMAFDTLVALTVPLLLLALFLGVIVEFLQVGPVASMKKLTPDASKLNPVEGIKKMFSMDNLVELVKAFFKSIALIFIGGVVLYGMRHSLMALPHAPPAAMGTAIWHGLLRIGIWTIVVFFFVSALDAWYQKFSYLKQL